VEIISKRLQFFQIFCVSMPPDPPRSMPPAAPCYVGLMYQSMPRPPIPPAQPPGIWPTLSSVQWGIWPKPRPTRWGIWLSCQNVCQRSETKRISQFFDTARELHSQIIALVHSTWGFFLLFSFYIIILWNMPLFKAWSEDKLNKKFVVAEILPVHV